MKPFISTTIITAVAIVCLFVGSGNTLAAPADLDPLFGTGGKLVAFMSGGGATEVQKVLIQPDGKIVAAGYSQTVVNSEKRLAIARFLPNGSFDLTFGTNGRTFTTITGGDAFIHDIAIQPNGRIVAVGMLYTGTSYSSVIARYTANGALDTSFSSDGLHVYNYNGTSSDHAVSVALQPDGKIVVASTALIGVGGSPNYSFYIARFGSTGSLDGTFNATGKTIGEFGLFTTGHVRIGLQPDGKIVAAGPGGNGSTIDFAVVRYNTNGSFDSTFGNAGRVYTHFSEDDVPRALAMLPDGRFVVGGYSVGSQDASLMLVRYTANGGMDTTFGFGGFVVSDLGDGNDVVESIAVQHDGKTVVAGRTGGVNPSNNDMLVARFNYNGLADSNFGTSGVKKINFGPSSDFGHTVAVQPNGRIVVAGAADVQSNSIPSFVLARVLGRGTAGDYDGDGKSDISVFRPGDGTWYLNRSSAGPIEYPFGISTDVPLVADFDGDGESDVSIFRPVTGRWYILRSTAGYTTAQFGLTGDIPTPVDFDGDGKSDIAVFRPSTGVWYYMRSSTGNSSHSIQQFGVNGDRPVPGDYDRDGRADLAVFRPSNAVWYVFGSTRGFYETRFGISTDVPVATDLDGDMVNDFVVFRPSDGIWHVLRSSDGGYQALRFGSDGDVPQAGDYDGDGRADIAVYRPTGGVWHLLRSATDSYQSVLWGLANDRPLASAIVE